MTFREIRDDDFRIPRWDEGVYIVNCHEWDHLMRRYR
jgi:hypothetical protein